MIGLQGREPCRRFAIFVEVRLGEARDRDYVIAEQGAGGLDQRVILGERQ